MRKHILVPALALAAASIAAGPSARGVAAPADDGAGQPAPLARPAVEVSIVADELRAARLREVLGEQLAGADVAVEWRRVDRFQPREILSQRQQPPAPSGDPARAVVVRVWIDLSMPAQALLYVKDERWERFVLRRVPLPRGVDEIGREEIGHIVRSATLGVLAGNALTLTREEARAVLEAPPPPAAPAPPALQRAHTTAARPAAQKSTLAIEVGPSWAVQAFAPGVWSSHEVALSATLASAAWPWAGWVEAAYRLPADFDGEPIGVEIAASSLRTGLALDGPSGARLALRAGAGAGVERTTFRPRPGAAAVELAAGDRFLLLSGRVFLGARLRLATHVVITLRLLCDLEAADVHYDVQDASGSPRRALTPFRVRPGLALGAAWRS